MKGLYSYTHINNIFLVILLLVLFSSCELTTDADFNFNFINQFNAAKIFPDREDQDTPTKKIALVLKDWEIGGIKRDAIITLAGGQVTFDLPKDRQGEWLYFGVGARFIFGDGVEGTIQIETEGGGKTVEYRRYINPAANANERQWFDEFLNLSQYNGRAIKVTFAAGPGPAGDYSADWFAWSTPVLTFYRK